MPLARQTRKLFRFQILEDHSTHLGGEVGNKIPSGVTKAIKMEEQAAVGWLDRRKSRKIVCQVQAVDPRCVIGVDNVGLSSSCEKLNIRTYRNPRSDKPKIPQCCGLEEENNHEEKNEDAFNVPWVESKMAHDKPDAQ